LVSDFPQRLVSAIGKSSAPSSSLGAHFQSVCDDSNNAVHAEKAYKIKIKRIDYSEIYCQKLQKQVFRNRLATALLFSISAVGVLLAMRFAESNPSKEPLGPVFDQDMLRLA